MCVGPMMAVTLTPDWRHADCIDLADMTVSATSHCKRYGQYGVSCPAGCEEIAADSACTNVVGSCLAAWMLWSAPWMVSLFSILFGTALYLISTSVAVHKHTGPGSKVLSKEVIIFCHCMVGIVVVAWAATSLAAFNMQLSRVVFAFAGLGAALGAMILCLAVGARNLQKSILEAQSLKDLGESEWWMTTFKALAILCLSPLFVIYLFTAYIKKAFRGYRGRSTDGERQLTAFKILEYARYSDKGAILARTVFMGTAYFVMQVAAARALSLAPY